jgi:carboxypeptidase Taq
MSDAIAALKARLSRIVRLNEANAVLGWDQQTYMPSGAAEARAEQMATLSEIWHETFTSSQTGDLIAAAEAVTPSLNPDSDDARMVKKVRRDFDKATKLPTELVAEMMRHETLSQEIWVKARAHSDFASFAPALKKEFELTRQKAECLGYTDHIYDALIDLYEPGMKHADVAKMFADMKPGLVELTHAIANSSNPVDDSLVYGDYPIDKQREVTLKLVEAIGFDMTHGRQDEAAHPFCTSFGSSDVRLTTRFDPKYLSQAIYASLHEAGHGMYEQGSPAQFEGNILAGGVSLGVHESQSRLWENLVGRSRAFVGWAFPMIQGAFPNALGSVRTEQFYRAVNKVEPSLIRVEADEVTYNLHVLIRFELESAILAGHLDVDDLPDAWDALYHQYLGITPPDDGKGCLQDVHWSAGLIGYFPTYTLGNLISGQLWNTIRKTLPDVNGLMAKGEFAPILDWLRTNIHHHASKFEPNELIQRATGEALTSCYYVDYLTGKYTDIYSL